MQTPYLMFGFGGFNLAFTAGIFSEAGLSRQLIAVQRQRDGRSEAFNQQNGKFHVHLIGKRNGKEIDETKSIDSIAQLIIADEEWKKIIELFCGNTLKYIFSNTAEKGFDIPTEDLTPPSERFGMPSCHIARMLVLLRARMEDGLPGLTLIPFELGETNELRLKNKLEELLTYWMIKSSDWRQCGQRLKEYIRWSCKIRGTLVDQMVPRLDSDHLLYVSGEDRLIRIAEPYRLLAIAGSPGDDRFFEHPDLIWCGDQQPYVLRKLCILNGMHTLIAAYWLKNESSIPRDMTVDQFFDNDNTRSWIMEILNEEILPAIRGLVPGEREFAEETLERFGNAALRFPISKIAGSHEQKLRDRLFPTARLYRMRTGKLPKLIQDAFAWSNLEDEFKNV